MRLLYDLGVRDVGENRDQEAAPKAAECADITELTWHFIGQLQTNKAASVVRYAGVVHSVDRLRLVRALGEQARKADRVITCLIQVSLDRDEARGGVGRTGGGRDRRGRDGGGRPAAGRGDGYGAARRSAGPGVRAAAAHRRRSAGELPEAVIVSAGMSGDMEEAIAAGATHVRIGTALLGGRPGFVR